MLVQHRKFTRTIPQVGGAIYFSAKDVKADRRNTTTRLVNRYYSRPAIAPGYGIPSTSPPAPPTDVRNRNGQLTWSAGDNNAVRYAVYQVPTTTTTTSPECDLIDARNLVAIVPATGANMQWQGETTQKTYVTAIDRWGQESPPAY